MQQIIEIRDGQSLPPGIVDRVERLDEKTLELHAPSSHFAMLRDNALVARCSIWTQGTPIYNDKPIGVVGHYAAAGPEAGQAILNHANRNLHDRGFIQIVGPMDGNTWRRYRLVTQRGDEPTFFLEPDSPDDWPAHFTAARFVPLATYFSALNSDLTVTDPRIPEAMQRLAADGVTIRSIDMARFEEELKAVHELSVEAFADNFLYTPISQAEFLSMYLPVKAHARPELILLAETKGQLIGFMFGLPDLLQAKRGKTIDTAIAKSMAVRPGRSGAGLGSVLMDQFQQAARKLGYTRVIHALMHENNPSMKISARFGKPIRQYTLYIQDTSR